MGFSDTDISERGQDTLLTSLPQVASRDESLFLRSPAEPLLDLSLQPGSSASLPAAARLQRTPFPAAPFAVLKRSTGSLGSVLRLVFAVPAAGPVCPVRATHLIKADGRGERASRWTQGSPPPCRLARRVRKGRCSQDAGSDPGGDRRPPRSRRLQAGQHRPAEMVNE